MPETSSAISLWHEVVQELRNLFPSDLFKMWFEDLRCLEESESSLVLAAPSDFNAIWIESNYLDIISQQAGNLSGKPVSVSVKVDPSSDSAAAGENTSAGGVSGRNQSIARESRRGASPARNGKETTRAPEQTRNTSLNARNTFDNFVVGATNQLAHAASIAVAAAPGRAYNPLFVFGDTGLGKTHLMHAVAHQMLANDSESRIAYVSTEKFTNEFIHAIRENKLAKFRKYYRTVDALLVDDIHFLSGKESTQEEFFHTFNDLFESGRQIFLASDRPANEIERLENRLISRFQWGLVTDIQAPDFETRVAILRKKAASMNIRISEEVMNFLAERVSRNIRRMEGALTRIAGYDALIDRKVDIASLERLLADLLHEERAEKVTVDAIQKKVAEYYKIRVGDLLGRRRTSLIVLPRHIAMYLARTLTGDPLKSIGDAFGGRDHGTVIHACKQVENMMEQDGSVGRAVEYLRKQLSQNRS